jgi:hypothetical protein
VPGFGPIAAERRADAGIAAVLAALALVVTAAPLEAAPPVSIREPAPVPTTILRVIPDSVRFDQKIADGNRVHMTATNYGFFGNNFINRTASLEYPAGLGYEHLVRGGVWVGARAQDALGTFVGVTAGAMDAAQGPSSPEASEWTPGDQAILRRSTSPASPYYDARAISDLDLVSRYNDASPTRAAGTFEDHRPIGIEVRQEIYQWNLPALENVLVVHLTLWNRGPTLADLWVGTYVELASGNKNAYVNWPPSSSDPSGQGGWFANKWIVYDAPQRLLREHYCDRPPLPPDPTNCRLERAPYWIGLQLLTPPDTAAGQRVTLAAWSWSPGSPFRDQDVERYALLAAGTLQPLTGDSLLPSTGDPVELLGVGPFPFLATGDSVTVDFAFVGGAEIDDIRRHAAAAQAAHDLDYRDVTVPVTLSRVRAEAFEGGIRIEWHASERGLQARVERRVAGGAWHARGTLEADGTGRMALEDRDVVPGLRHGYRLTDLEGIVLDGSEVWVDAREAPGFALAALPGTPASVLRFGLRLAGPEPARLEVLDLAGRRVWSRSWDAGAGTQEVRIEGLASGVYIARLRQGARSMAVRAIVTR